MLRNYIGLGNSCHDPALAIVNSQGEVVFAEAAERYLQNKRGWCNPPDDFLRISNLLKTYCEKDADLVLASTWRRSTLRLAEFFTFNRIIQNPVCRSLLGLLQPETPLPDILSQILITHTGNKTGLNTEFATWFENQARITDTTVIRKSYSHHLTHAAAACFSCPFEEALCVVIDAFGEGSSTAVFRYERGKLEAVPGIKSSTPSLGLFYSKLCNACGFDFTKGEEWKVMGLAPYGKRDNSLHESLNSLMKAEKGRLVYKSRRSVQKYEAFINEHLKKKIINPYDAADLAFTGQLVFSEITAALLNSIYEMSPSENLVLSGGCALNSAFVGTVQERVSGFNSTYVFCAPADDGNALGAALLAYQEDYPHQKKATTLRLPYLGSSMSESGMTHLKRYSKLKCIAPKAGETVPEKAAKLLAEGKIIGWAQGRAEFGPRALGNRSILADPRLPDVKSRLNAEVKYREEFRPFAPSILHEYGPEYFENYQETPYMERALRFRPEVKEKVPGVVHVDGTGRLQTVKREWNPRFYDLIMAFFKLTGVPIVLNTSFNVMGKPIIHSVEDAVAVFMTTGMDILVIEDHIYSK